MKLEILRNYLPGGTNGKILWDGKLICNSIELPWKDNKHNISCIPEGTYRLRKRFTEKRGWHLIVTDVPGRDLILIHPANDARKELLGCIAPVTTLTGEGKGDNSRMAVAKVNAAVFPYLEKGFVISLTIKKV